MLWFWRTKNEIDDMAALRRNVLLMDTARADGAEHAEPTPWKMKISFLVRADQNPRGQQPQGARVNANEATSMIKVENPLKSPNEAVHVISEGSPKLTKDEKDGITRFKANPRYTVVQVGNGISILPVYSEYKIKKDLSVDGSEYVIGDFKIRSGVCKIGSSATYILIWAIFLPEGAPDDLERFRDMEKELGLGGSFPCSTLWMDFSTFPNFPSKYGPMHEAVELTNMIAIMRSNP